MNKHVLSPVVERFWRVHFAGPIMWEEVTVHVDPLDNTTRVHMQLGCTSEDVATFVLPPLRFVDRPS